LQYSKAGAGGMNPSLRVNRPLKLMEENFIDLNA
jgi:hypothetical protein